MSADRTTTTFYFERWRAGASGILETASQTFLLLIAVRWLEAGAIAKALVAGGGSVGLLLSPLAVSGVERLGWPTTQSASRMAGVGAVCFLIMAIIPTLPIFVVGTVVAMTTATAAIPLVTQMYQENYPAAHRGRRFSRTVMIRIATAATFSQLGGQILEAGSFRWLLGIFCGAFAFAAFCLSRCPSRPLRTHEGGHPFRSLRFLRRDRGFRQALIAWMVMGFGNLMMFPMRVEYLANPEYGIALTSATIALLTGVIPNVARLILSPGWGWVFDHLNFFLLRMALNLIFALGILVFFSSAALPGFVVGAVIFGIGSAGGDVAWSLWVTKFAPPDRVADYMSVHTFFTGVRGLAAPLLAFNLTQVISLTTLSWISIGLILLATAWLIPEVRRAPNEPRAALNP